MIGYVMLHSETYELVIDCTDETTIADFAMSGRIWMDKDLALAALIDHLTRLHDTPAYLAEVILPDPKA